MDVPNQYQNLRFDRRTPAVPPVLVTLGIAGGLFILLWLTLPPQALFWLLLLSVLGLTWLARYGWRDGLSALIAFLHRLENL